MKFRILDPNTDSNILGDAEFPIDHSALIKAVPVGHDVPYHQLDIHQSAIYEIWGSGTKTSVKILRVE